MDLRDKKTKITFYAGMRTIGGTYIEVKYENHRIIFDCGAVFNTNIDDENVSLEELINLELAPRINNLFDRRIVNFTDQNINTAVFVSHAHLDHTKMINFIDESIDIYTSRDTKNLINAVNINGKFLYKNNLLNKNTRSMIGVNYDETVVFGNIKVKFVKVDHDAYGSCGFIIETPEIKISYTGDIRLHGNLINESERFIKLSKNSDILISEGVSVSFDDNKKEDNRVKIFNKEDDAIKEFIEICESDNNIILNLYIANIQRLLRIINESSKEVILSEYYAYVLFKTTGVKVRYYGQSYEYNLDDSLRVNLNKLDKNNKYIIQADQDLFDIFEILKDSKNIYVHFDASPLGLFDVNYKPFFDRVEKYKNIVKILKCSGHANSNDLQDLINRIDAKLLIPIHSFKPEMLYNKKGRLLPKKNETI